MDLLQKSPAERFTPKAIKFSNLYRYSSGGGKLGANILIDAKAALSKSGFTDKQIAEIVTADKPISVGRMKEVAGVLNRARIFGFEKSPESTVKRFLDKERVKAQNIARIRKEQILEAAEENLANVGVTSLNQKAIGPNNAKSGGASVLARRHNPAVRSLAGGTESKRIGSFNSRPSAGAISRPGMGATGATRGGIAIKPKF